MYFRLCLFEIWKLSSNPAVNYPRQKVTGSVLCVCVCVCVCVHHCLYVNHLAYCLTHQSNILLCTFINVSTKIL